MLKTILCIFIGSAFIYQSQSMNPPFSNFDAPVEEEKKFVDYLLRSDIIKIDGSQDFVDFIRENLQIIVHNKVGKALLIQIYDCVKNHKNYNVIITPRFFSKTPCAWPSKNYLNKLMEEEAEIIPQNFKNLIEASDDSVVVEMEELQKYSTRADTMKENFESEMGFDMHNEEIQKAPCKIVPITSTADETLFHELNHARLYIETYLNQDILDFALSTASDVDNGSLNTPIYAMIDGKQKNISRIMPELLETRIMD